MRARLLCALLAGAGLILAFTCIATAQTPANVGAVQSIDGLTLNVPLVNEPDTLDPVKDYSAGPVAEQLFIALVDLDDDTGDVLPELATDWTVSADGLVYTFTLRSDIAWSDGRPVTAGDARYGILRSLDPATEAWQAYVLYVIEGAEAYSLVPGTDPEQVGVLALDDTHLQITLVRPAAYLPSLLSTWVARPLPEWAIDAWGDAWTEPAHIVTNGAYRLVEWQSGDHILLEKNPDFYDAGNVQIERVRFWPAHESAAWQMYLNGNLDTADVPLSQPPDPLLELAIHKRPTGIVRYYGFSVSQAPFDNALVRKAFAAATDRVGLILEVNPSMPIPALTYTTPGVFGHVDGYAEGIGLRYNPGQARRWLAQAGYPNGEGLPAITLSYSTSQEQRRMAEYVRDTWAATLGVSVTLESVPVSEYGGRLFDGEFQIWRNGWGLDYSDAYNFLADGVYEESAHGGWNNPTYENLLEQALREQDPETRGLLYRQAEEILVETDAVMIPLYYDVDRVAARAYLERTYPVVDFDVATWRITRVSGAISAGGGSLVSYNGKTTITVPASAIADTIVITHTPAYGMPPGGNLADIGQVFEITAVYSDTGQPAALQLPYTLNVHYSDADRWSVTEDTLALYSWDGELWTRESGSAVDTPADIVSATPDSLGLWAVFGETHRVFNPIILKDR